MQHLAGRISDREVVATKAAYSYAKQELQRLQQKRRALRARLCFVHALGSVAASALILRRKVSWPFGAALIGSAVVTAIAIIIGRVLTSNLSVVVWTGSVAALLAVPAHVLALLYPADDFIRKRLDELEIERTNLQRQLAPVESALKQAQSQFRAARERVKQLEEVIASRLHRLLTTDWRGLRSVEFELFLKRVFEEQGYRVETTKVSGDQGVDLIICRDGCRTAIQVKGYLNSVGNSAVQEAHTGMVFYSCDRCAVITNSVFTSHARALAAKIGCTLIDGTQIVDLIRGRIRL